MTRRPRPVPSSRIGQKGWVNPYAYIPLAAKPSERRPSIAHDTFTGHSGWIDVTFTTETPLHTSGGAAGDGTLGFLTLDGRYVLAGASLKGMLRTTFERLTGSCLRVVDLDRRFSSRVSVRDKAERTRYVGTHLFKVTELTSDGGARLEPLTCDPMTDKVKVSRTPLAGLRDGDHVQRFQSQVVKDDQGDWRLKLSDKAEQVRKYHQFVYQDGDGTVVQIGKVVVDRYNASIQASIDEDRRRQKSLGLSESDDLPCDRTINSREDIPASPWGCRSPHHLLQVGDVVWANGSDAKTISPSRIHRKPHAHGVRDAVPKDFRPCERTDQLCWACRVFGMVFAEKEHEGHDQVVAGHVRVGWGYGPEVSDELTILPLPPLLSPKPSFGSFSLLNVDAERAPTWDDNQVEIGGHRVYWHRNGVVTRQEGGDDRLAPTVQALDAETGFRCRIAFDNLADEDLGMLIAAIDPRRLGDPFTDAAHKFGMGRSVGLGSVRADINGITLVDRAVRYQGLDTDGTATLEPDSVEVEDMVTGARHEIGLDERETVPSHLTALAAVMSLQNRFRTTYPGHGAGDDKGYEWYATHRDEPLATPAQTVGGGRQSALDPGGSTGGGRGSGGGRPNRSGKRKRGPRPNRPRGSR